ncbi:hypothetical protein cyc_03827 [Cyclospora cayetanensis]|uniref:Uncharacterized protein n=1 Tax=Cyclospora cayetanensis TaxID=88456 RepID=A0A1D3CS47_9EIME|nr:hypothetical protein cyc_03827 [Cyclospora cayetanensis]
MCLSPFDVSHGLTPRIQLPVHPHHFEQTELQVPQHHQQQQPPCMLPQGSQQYLGQHHSELLLQTEDALPYLPPLELESFPRLLQPIPVSAASAQHALASATQEMPSSATAIQAKATKVNPKTYTLERLQDKWLADRLNESVNWKRLHVDSADLSKSLVAAKQFYNLVTGPAGPIGGKGSSTDFSQEHPTSHSGNTSKSQVLLELLKQSEVLADNLDQLLGMLHSLEREAHAEGIGFSPRGWKLVQSTEEALGAAGAFAETLDDVASSDSSISLRGSSRLPATVLRLRSALGSFGSNPSARKLSDAIRAQQLADLLQGSSLRHLAARPLPKNGSESVSPAKEAVLS